MQMIGLCYSGSVCLNPDGLFKNGATVMGEAKLSAHAGA